MPRQPDADHRRPPGVSDDVVAAVGRLDEAFDRIERARGSLYDFHQLIGGAHNFLAEACERLEAAGHPTLARELYDEIVGLDVVGDMWTFEVVEDFEDHYYAAVKRAVEEVRDRLVGGRRHLHEAEMKAERQP